MEGIQNANQVYYGTEKTHKNAILTVKTFGRPKFKRRVQNPTATYVPCLTATTALLVLLGH
jgi:hypothetical protein